MTDEKHCYFQIIESGPKGSASFPEQLGPFSLLEASKVKDNIQIGSAENYWELSDRGKVFKGSLSANCMLTLSAPAKQAANIPDAATCWFFAYASIEATGNSQYATGRSALSPDDKFIKFGGFIYRNDDMEIVSVKSFEVNPHGEFLFGPPEPLKETAIQHLRMQLRIHDVTMPSLLEAGATEFCLLQPFETFEDGTEAGFYGGFAYIFGERKQLVEPEEERQKQEAERKQQEEEAERKRQEEEAERKRQEEAAERKRQEEDAQRKRQEEEAERKRQEEEAERKRQEEEAEQKRQKEEAEAERKRQEEEAERKRQEEEAERKRQEEDAERKRQEEDAERKRQEEEAERKRQKEKEEAELKRKQEEDEANQTASGGYLQETEHEKQMRLMQEQFAAQMEAMRIQQEEMMKQLAQANQKVNELEHPKCKVCGKEVTDKRLGDYCSLECMPPQCGKCGKEITATSFEDEGVKYCSKACLPIRCHKCNELVEDDRWNFKSFQYCRRECMPCITCGTDINVGLDNSGNPQCTACYHRVARSSTSTSTSAPTFQPWRAPQKPKVDPSKCIQCKVKPKQGASAFCGLDCYYRSKN